MSVRTDTVNLIVNINGNEAQNNLNKLRKRASELTFEMQGLKKGTAEYIAKSKELQDVNSQMGELKKQIGLTSLNQKELSAELSKLKALQGSVIPFSDEYKQLGESISEVEDRLYDVRNGTTGFASFLGKLSDEIKAFGVAAAAYLAFDFLVTQITGIVQGAAKLSDQLADLQRVAGLTKDEAQRLNSSLKDIDTRTATGGLREIAIVAGKLGVAKDDIFGFTEAVDHLVVSLGDELGDADQITTKLGKIINVFDGKITGENISQLGNAFVQLANTGAATGGFIAEFDSRLSGIAKSSGISLGALSGLGAGLEEMGSKVESSSTAIQKLIIGVNTDIPAAAKIAGQSTKDFNKLLQIDPTEAILKYSQGLVKNKESFAAVTASLHDAGEEGVRTIETISKLGNSADVLRGRIDLGKKSIQETGAITAAFALKNETFGASLDKLGKQFSSFASSGAINSFLQSAVLGISSFLKSLSALPKFIDDNSTALKFLATGIALMNFQYIKAAVVIAYDTLAKIRNTIITYASAVATKAVAVATAIAETAQASYIVVTNLLTGRIGFAIAAQRLWNLAMTLGAGPIGIIITLIGAAVVGFNLLTGSSKEVATTLTIQNDTLREGNAEISRQKAELEGLTNVVKSNTASHETKVAMIAKLIAISPEYLNRLTLENIATGEGKRILDDYNKSLQNSASLKAAQNITNKAQEKVTNLNQIKQELEIYQAEYAKGNYKAEKNLSPEAKDFKLENSFGQDQFGLAAIKKQIDEQTKFVELTSTNFSTVSNKSIEDRRAFLLHDITVAKAEQNAAVGNQVAYDKATKTLEASRDKFNNEFGNAKKPKGLSDYIPTGEEDDKAEKAKEKARKKAEAASARQEKKDDNDFERLKEKADKFNKELLALKDRAIIKGEEPEQAEIDAVKAKFAKLLEEAQGYYVKHAIDEKQFNADKKIMAEASAQELQNIFDKYYKLNFAKTSAEEYETSLADRSEYTAKLKAEAVQEYADGKITKKQYAIELTQIDRNETHDRTVIAEDYSDTVKKAAKDVTTFKKTEEKQATADLIEETDKRINAASRDKLSQAERKVMTARPNSDGEFKAKQELLQVQLEQDLEFQDYTNEEKLTRQAQFNEDSEELEKQRVKGLIDTVLTYVSHFTNALNSLNTILNNKENAQFAKEKTASDKKKKLYKDQLDHKLISKGVYDAKVAALDLETDKKEKELKRKQAQREKVLNLFNAVISVAAGIASSLAYGGPVGIALAIATGIAGALQIAAIASTPLPELGTGDWIKKGAKHSDKEGGIPVKIERDEAVIKADAMTSDKIYSVTGNTAQITSALNEKEGGKSWASGAKLEKPETRKSVDHEVLKTGIVVKMNEYGTGDWIRERAKNLKPPEDSAVTAAEEAATKKPARIVRMLGLGDWLKTSTNTATNEINSIEQTKNKNSLQSLKIRLANFFKVSTTDEEKKSEMLSKQSDSSSKTSSTNTKQNTAAEKTAEQKITTGTKQGIAARENPTNEIPDITKRTLFVFPKPILINAVKPIAPAKTASEDPKAALQKPDQQTARKNTGFKKLIYGLGDWIKTGAKHKDKEGGIPVMIERDEAIIKAAAMNSSVVYTVTGTTSQITSVLNSKEGGKAWATGAVINMPAWRTEKAASINPDLPRIMEQGGIVRPLMDKDQADQSSGNSNELSELLRINNQLLKEQIDVTNAKADKIRAIVSIKEFDAQRALYDQSKKASGIA